MGFHLYLSCVQVASAEIGSGRLAQIRAEFVNDDVSAHLVDPSLNHTPQQHPQI